LVNKFGPEEVVTKGQLLAAAKQAVLNLNDPQLELRFAERNSQTSNVWRIGCQQGFEKMEVSLYLFPDASSEKAVELIQDQLLKTLR
jgi:hypothetical protein